MDRRLLHHYNNELTHLRHTAAEFAREFPKIAGRLALDAEGMETCADPFVERLLEGFAFLAARVHVKMDAEFPRFTQSLLETVYPHYLCPTPSMAVVRFDPLWQEGSLNAGYPIPRGTALRTPLARGQRTACEYRTAHALTLWPLQVVETNYFTRELAQFHLPPGLGARAVLRIRLQTTTGAALNTLPLERLTFYLRGSDDLPDLLYEQIFAHGVAVTVAAPGSGPSPAQVLPAAKGSLRRVGFEREEALMPHGPRSFSGYRLLREYFAFRQRFLFFEMTGLAGAVSECTGDTADFLVVLNAQQPRLEGRVDAGSTALYCTPAINLFTKRTDRIPLADRFSEYQVIVDRTRPFDFEVYDIEGITGYGKRSGEEQPFRPFYLAKEGDHAGASGAFYTVHRAPRQLTAKERTFGQLHTYTGTEAFVSLVDASNAPFGTDLQQLGATVTCTNRHLPLEVAFGLGLTDFTLEISAPVESVRCVSGPTPPRPPFSDGEVAWRLISHLSLNYLSLLDAPGGEGASGLREILRLYVDASDTQTLQQIAALRSASTRPILRRLEVPGPITFVRGLEVTVDFDETPFEGSSVFLFGSMLEHFFRRYVAINSFTETVIRTEQRKEIMRWKAQIGQRPIF
jgi:type VI secretion system protein ImpG